MSKTKQESLQELNDLLDEGFGSAGYRREDPEEEKWKRLARQDAQRDSDTKAGYEREDKANRARRDAERHASQEQQYAAADAARQKTNQAAKAAKTTKAEQDKQERLKQAQQAVEQSWRSQNKIKSFFGAKTPKSYYGYVTPPEGAVEEESVMEEVIQESVREALTENVDVRRVILENRLALINKILDKDESLNEGLWQNIKNLWKGYDDSDLEKDPTDPTANYMMGRPDSGYKSQAHTPGGGGETGYKTNPGVATGVTELDPSAVVDNPEQSAKIVSRSVAQGKASVAKFKANSVKSATAISGLQDAVEDMFGQFYNLINSLPEESRGVLERDVMQVMGSFYSALANEKAVIQGALNGLFVKANAQGYNLAQAGEAMSKYRPGQEAEVEEPVPARAPAPVRAPARAPIGATEE